MKTILKAIRKIAAAHHARRASSLARSMLVHDAECEMLKISEQAYGNSYYTDMLRAAVCARIETTSKKKYHEDRAAELRQPETKAP